MTDTVTAAHAAPAATHIVQMYFDQGSAEWSRSVPQPADLFVSTGYTMGGQNGNFCVGPDLDSESVLGIPRTVPESAEPESS